MRKKEYNRYSMYKSVLLLFESCGERLNSIPALMEVIKTFSELVTQIEELNLQYTTISKGATSYKRNTRSELMTETERICGVLYAYGRKSKDNNLVEIADIKIRALKKMRDIVLLQKANEIVSILNDIRADLNDYGVNEDMILDYKELVKNYDESLNKRTTCKCASIIARRKLTESFIKADTLLKDDIDRLMKLIPECRGRYQVARNVIHAGVRHNKNLPTNSSAEVQNQESLQIDEELVSEENSPSIYQIDLFSSVSS